MNRNNYIERCFHDKMVEFSLQSLPSPSSLASFIILAVCSSLLPSVTSKEVRSPLPSSASGLVFVSTIDGYLRAIDPFSGVDQWQIKEDPVLQSPIAIEHGFTFLPDPQDGSLYMLRDGQLKKLPFSIPQLVSASPCRSNDGVLYAGSKKDVWFGLNAITGAKEEELSQSSVRRQCPASSDKTIFIGRSEYHLSMFDAENHMRRWNATFTDYSSHLLPADISYPYQHFASTPDGRLITLDGSTGAILWERNFGSTIVAIYLLQTDGLHNLRYTVLGKETMEELIRNGWERKTSDWVDDFLRDSSDGNEYARANTIGERNSLFPVLYVGESEYGLYALPAFVDERTITIAPKYLGPPLLEGPMPIAVETENAPRNTPSSRPIVRINIEMPSITHRTVEGEFLLLGYHEPPDTIKLQLHVHQQSSKLVSALPSITYVPSPHRADYLDEALQNTAVNNRKQRHLHNERDWTMDIIITQLWRHHPGAFASTLITVALLLLTTVWMCGRQSGVASFVGEARSAQTSKRGTRYWPLLTNDTPDGWMQVGSIFYDPQSILGRGCEGTIVYRGRFDGREVAVKRVMIDFVRLVDREVDLLRESDTHSHVIRYFCMESDSLFRYIALELCDSSLYEYVEREAIKERCPLGAMDILQQATDGVAYLHSINIVHRDIKPQNVLLSIPNRHGQVRALISDFGLCKRLQSGRNSVSRRSGLAGTDGWIAPEALLSDASTTCAADVFSLGCVYYYVLTNGKHPFGDNLRRQANIMQGEYSLKTLNLSSNVIGVTLIESMLQRDAGARPSAAELVLHPFFWSKERQLQFFSDVSDRVEKETEQSSVVQSLERDARSVVTNNWRQVIGSALAEDLRKFRTYKGNSVRDLLRAMRNKKHHYRELPDNVRQSLGHIPDQFVTYFTERFPNLLLHTYEAMRVCANECIFNGYYSDDIRQYASSMMSNQNAFEPLSTKWTAT